MGGVLSYFSSSSKSRTKSSDDVQEETRQEPRNIATPQEPSNIATPQEPSNIATPQKPKEETDEISRNLKSTAVLNRDDWDEVLDSAIEEPADIPVNTINLQLQAQLLSSRSGDFLCVRKDGQVCLDGTQNALNTIFKVSKVYPPPIDKYQFKGVGGSSQNYVLYPEGTNMKAKPFDADKDYVCKDTAEPTLLNIEIQNEGGFSITIESREGAFSGTDSQPIRFIPFFVESF